MCHLVGHLFVAMHSLLLGFAFFLLVFSEQIDSKDCEKKGFASTLLCSSCDKLASFVGDSGTISILMEVMG